MPILSGVSGNALAAAFALYAWIPGSALDGPAEGSFSIAGGVLAVRDGPGVCQKGCGTSVTVAADLDEDADGRHLVVGGGSALWSDATGHFDFWGDDNGDIPFDHVATWSDASGHLDLRATHLGAGDTHCFALAADVAESLDPDGVWNVQLGKASVGGVSTRVEPVNNWAGAGAEAYLACATFDDDGGLASLALLGARGFDDVLARPQGAGGRFALVRR